jgi:hypothetical protein
VKETRTERQLRIHAAHRRGSIEQFEADFERQLLAGKRINQGLEHTGKPWRLYAAESFSKNPQSRISFCHSVPFGQIDTWTEQAVRQLTECVVSLAPSGAAERSSR